MNTALKSAAGWTQLISFPSSLTHVAKRWRFASAEVSNGAYPIVKHEAWIIYSSQWFELPVKADMAVGNSLHLFFFPPGNSILLGFWIEQSQQNISHITTLHLKHHANPFLQSVLIVDVADTVHFHGHCQLLNVMQCNALALPGHYPQGKVQGCLLFNAFSINTGRFQWTPRALSHTIQQMKVSGLPLQVRPYLSQSTNNHAASLMYG